MWLKKPWLLLPAKVAHDFSSSALRLWSVFAFTQDFSWKPFTWRGLHFRNPLGPSGGVDKNGELIKTWWAFGAGFIEIGTVTPRPQQANPGKIIKRDNRRFALWNKMGFPNDGVDQIKTRLKKIKRPYVTPIFINIGKNRDTENARAAEDYLICIRELREYADAFVVNVSSPNTADLRDLLKPENLKSLLQPLLNECRGRSDRATGEHQASLPLILKLSPDMSDTDFRTALDVSFSLGIDGWILTNTTLSRDAGLHFPAEGGVSGQPLTDRSKTLLKLAVDHLGDRRAGKLLISVGGVMTPQDVFERLRLGAQLVQVYTALVFEGPKFFLKVANESRAVCKN